MTSPRTINPIGPEQRTERNTTRTQTFAKRSLNQGGGRFLREYGYRPDDRPVPVEYLARVTSIRHSSTVIAPLQQDILMRVDSRWVPLVPTSLLATGNIFLQTATGGRKSLVTKATSRRIWSGSSPMVLNLRMQFEAVEDPLAEVVEPLRILSSIALASEPDRGSDQTRVSQHEYIQDIASKLDQIPVLGPPGPTPFTLEGILNSNRASSELGDTTAIAEGLRGGDKIMVELGRFLTFYNVIVSSVSSSVPIKFGPDGYPISATINLTFETYEMMTAEGLQDAFQKTRASARDSVPSTTYVPGLSQ